MHDFVPTILYVEQFHKKFGQPVAITPVIPELIDRRLRLSLLIEEVEEFAKASGFYDLISMRIWNHLRMDLAGYKDINNCSPIDIIEAADALADIDYVTAGANLTWGFPAGRIIKEVHESNMSKLDSNGEPIIRADGKILKGPGYFKPRIAEILAEVLSEKRCSDIAVELGSLKSHNIGYPHTDSSR